jgi:hypothetical protein
VDKNESNAWVFGRLVCCEPPHRSCHQKLSHEHRLCQRAKLIVRPNTKTNTQTQNCVCMHKDKINFIYCTHLFASENEKENETENNNENE